MPVVHDCSQQGCKGTSFCGPLVLQIKVSRLLCRSMVAPISDIIRLLLIPMPIGSNEITTVIWASTQEIRAF